MKCHVSPTNFEATCFSSTYTNHCASSWNNISYLLFQQRCLTWPIGKGLCIALSKIAELPVGLASGRPREQHSIDFREIRTINVINTFACYMVYNIIRKIKTANTKTEDARQRIANFCWGVMSWDQQYIIKTFCFRMKKDTTH